MTYAEVRRATRRYAPDDVGPPRRDAPEPPPIDRAAAEHAADTAPPPHDVLRDLFTGGLRLPIGLVRQVRDLLADPTGIPDAGNAAADTIRGVMSQLTDVERSAPAHATVPHPDGDHTRTAEDEA